MLNTSRRGALSAGRPASCAPASSPRGAGAAQQASAGGARVGRPGETASSVGADRVVRSDGVPGCPGSPASMRTSTPAMALWQRRWAWGIRGRGACRTAEMLIAESGTEMTRVPSADSWASWTRVALARRHASAHAHQARRGRALAAGGPPWCKRLTRLASRRGKKRARRAVAHAILVMADDGSQRRGDHVSRQRPATDARPDHG
jgi:hypothetical protein